MLLLGQTIGEYKMTKSNLKIASLKMPTVSLDGSINYNGEIFTPTSLANHGASVHEKLWILQEDTLNVFKELGDIQIQLRLLYPDNKKFSIFISGTDYANVSPQDRSDAKFIAENWSTIQKLNKDSKLDSLGVNSIRKKTKEFLNPKPKAAAASKAKAAKVAADAKEKSNANKAELLALPVFNTPKDLADFVVKSVKDNQLDFVEFLQELTGLAKAQTKKTKK
jgi:hypothetical protein